MVKKMSPAPRVRPGGGFSTKLSYRNTAEAKEATAAPSDRSKVAIKRRPYVPPIIGGRFPEQFGRPLPIECGVRALRSNFAVHQSPPSGVSPNSLGQCLYPHAPHYLCQKRVLGRLLRKFDERSGSRDPAGGTAASGPPAKPQLRHNIDFCWFLDRCPRNTICHSSRNDPDGPAGPRTGERNGAGFGEMPDATPRRGLGPAP